jgi:methylenetetrahydrofolate reductase (NADPH)
LQDYGDDIASLRALGVDVVTSLCEKLLAGGASGLHFYTMNQSGIIGQITNNLGLEQS